MKSAKKLDVEGPIGVQLNKKQYSKMLVHVDIAMQKALIKKKTRKTKSFTKKAAV